MINVYCNFQDSETDTIREEERKEWKSNPTVKPLRVNCSPPAIEQVKYIKNFKRNMRPMFVSGVLHTIGSYSNCATEMCVSILVRANWVQCENETLSRSNTSVKIGFN